MLFFIYVFAGCGKVNQRVAECGCRISGPLRSLESLGLLVGQGRQRDPLSGDLEEHGGLQGKITTYLFNITSLILADF